MRDICWLRTVCDAYSDVDDGVAYRLPGFMLHGRTPRSASAVCTMSVLPNHNA